MGEIIGFGITALILTFILSLIGFGLYSIWKPLGYVYGAGIGMGLLYVWFLWLMTIKGIIDEN